ncbi:unnamed protein product, partial [Scytosiphon promiscuus]
MSVLESYRDSRSAEGPLPIATAAAVGVPTSSGGGSGSGADGFADDATAPQNRHPAAGNSGNGGNGGGGGGGQDVVFPLVLALYAQQERCRRQRRKELANLSKRAAAAAAGGCVSSGTAPGGMVVVDVVCSGGDGALGRVVVGGGGGGDDEYDDRGDGGFSAEGVAAAAADGAAAVCGDWEGEAKALVRKLREARRAFPSEVEFYLLQLCIVVALGDFVRPVPLVEFLLELCESDLRLAHKTHWFLKSFCAGGAGSPLLLTGLSAFAQRVQKRGCVVASRLSRSLSRQAALAAAAAGPAAADAPLCDGIIDHDPAAAAAAAAAGTAVTAFPAAKTTSARFAEAPAAAPATTWGASSASGGAEHRSSSDARGATAAAADGAAAGDVAGTAASSEAFFSGGGGEQRAFGEGPGRGTETVAAVAAVAVVDEGEDGVLRRVWQGDSSMSDGGGGGGGHSGGGGAEESGRRRQHTGQGVDGGGEGDEEDDSLAEHYDPAMFFVEALLGLAEQLGDLPPKKRANGLQEGLERINEFFLSERAQGSDVIYVPFRGGFHQIRAIHPRESMHFSTKERVPLLVCLEVREVHLPPSLTSLVRAGSSMVGGSDVAAAAAATATAGSGSSSTLVALDGSGGGVPRGGGVVVSDAAGGRAAVGLGGGHAAAMERGESMAEEAEHAGEAGLMDRFRGTVRSFVKLQSDDGYHVEGVAGDEGRNEQQQQQQQQQAVEPSAGSLPVRLPPHRRPRHLGESIEGDECSSRTASEPDPGHGNSNPLLSSLSAASGDGGSPSPSPVGLVSGRHSGGGGGGAISQQQQQQARPALSASPGSVGRTASKEGAEPTSDVAEDEGVARDCGGGGGGGLEHYRSGPEDGEFGDDERETGEGG